MRDVGDEFRLRGADDPASLLIVILDTSVQSWIELTGKSISESVAEASLAIRSVADQLLAFLNTFSLLHEANRVAFITSGSDGSRVVHPVFPDEADLPPDYDVNIEDCALDGTAGHTGANISLLDPEKMSNDLQVNVVDGVIRSMREQENSTRSSHANIAGALASALCLLNRLRRIKAKNSGAGTSLEGTKADSADSDNAPANGRILVVVAGEDSAQQYVPLMNCMFSAQRIGIPIDSCILSKQDSTYFQQAAHITNGVYQKPDGFSTQNPDCLMQYLQTVFLVDKHSRDFLAMPTPEKVDFRASCLVTKKVIDHGYVCSVCLSTFDVSVGKDAPMCPICDARFAI